jgi:hypothetical protein
LERGDCAANLSPDYLERSIPIIREEHPNTFSADLKKIWVGMHPPNTTYANVVPTVPRIDWDNDKDSVNSGNILVFSAVSISNLAAAN